MVEYLIQDATLTNLGDKIRVLSGTEDAMTPAAMASNVDEANTEVTTQADLIAQIASALEGKAVDSGGTTAEPVLQSKTVSPSTSQQTITPDSGYDGLSSVVVNAMPTAGQATPNIAVSESGLITASVTQDAGYVEAGTKSATHQLTTEVWTFTLEDDSTVQKTVVIL